MKFKSRIDLFFGTILFCLTLVLIFPLIMTYIYNKEITNQFIYTFLIHTLILVFVFWIYFGTNYELTKEKFIYKCGPIRRAIDINRINKIIKDKTLWVGVKVATSRKGLIIKYDKHKEVYISPRTNKSFIDKMLEINNQIIIE